MPTLLTALPSVRRGSAPSRPADSGTGIDRAAVPGRAHPSRRGILAMPGLIHVVGARPNFIKAAPGHRGPGARPASEQRLVHTGQHYDRAMSDVFFEELDLPAAGRQPRRRDRAATARQTAALAGRPGGGLPGPTAGRASSSTATSTPRWRRRSSAPSCSSRSRTWRPACAPSTRPCPRRSTAASPTCSADPLFVTAPEGRGQPRRRGHHRRARRLRGQPHDRHAAARTSTGFDPGPVMARLGLDGRYARGDAASARQRGLAGRCRRRSSAALARRHRGGCPSSCRSTRAAAPRSARPASPEVAGPARSSTRSATSTSSRSSAAPRRSSPIRAASRRRPRCSTCPA